MSKGKLIGIFALVLLAAVAAVVYFGYTNLDRIVQAAIEKYGSQVTQTRVAVNDVSLTLTEGKAVLGGLSVANPKGFSGREIFSLGRISVAVDPASVTRDTIVISEILIDAPNVLYEIDKTGGSNLETLKRTLARAVSKGKAASQEETGKPGKKLIIQRLVIDKGQADVDLHALLDKSMSVQLPRIELTHIGEKSGGATPAEVGRIVLDALSKRTEELVAGMGVEQMINEQLQQQLGKAGEAAQKALSEKLEKEVGTEAGKTAEEALKGLLGGKKE